jgi:hypothetical protein
MTDTYRKSNLFEADLSSCKLYDLDFLSQTDADLTTDLEIATVNKNYLSSIDML